MSSVVFCLGLDIAAARAVWQVDETTAPFKVRSDQKDMGVSERVDAFIQATTPQQEDVHAEGSATDSNGEDASVSAASDLPEDTQGWIHDLIELFKRAVEVLGDVARRVVEDILNAFRTTGGTL